MFQIRFLEEKRLEFFVLRLFYKDNRRNFSEIHLKHRLYYTQKKFWIWRVCSLPLIWIANKIAEKFLRGR